MAKFIDRDGLQREVSLDMSLYVEASKAGMAVHDYFNKKYPTRNGEALSSFEQALDSLGFVMSSAGGMSRASRLADVLDGTLAGAVAAANTAQGTPESRLIFPAAVLALVEDKLKRDLETAPAAYDRLVAHTDNIQGNQFVRVVTNYDIPEAARNRATAQLARPANMGLLTAVERPGVVPIASLGLEWSDQVMQGTTIEFVALSLARQIRMQRYANAQDSIIALLNGDEDVPMAALPAAYRKKAVDFDPTITQPGVLTQTAWVKWLYDGSDFRQIDWIITDIDTALAIENRLGKPVVVGDDAKSPRIDSNMRIANPLIPANVNVFVTTHPDWPAGTVMGLMSSEAITRVTSLTSNYQATERNAITRSNTMRWDSGSISYRAYDEAFSVLELVL